MAHWQDLTTTAGEAENSSLAEYEYEYSPAHPATVASYYIWTHIPPAFWLSGTVGNILIIIVFSRKGMRGTSTAVLFRALAVFDMFSLLESLESIFALTGFVGIAYSRYVCKICYWFLDSSKGIAAWILMGISIERCTGICVPHKASLLFTPRRAKIFLVCLILFKAVLYSPNFIMWGVFEFYEPVLEVYKPYCTREPWAGNRHIDYFAVDVYPWIQLTSYCFIPVVVLFVVNIIILTRLYAAVQQRRSMGATGSGSNALSMVSLTTMLLSASIAFLVLTTPWCVYYLIWAFVDIGPHQFFLNMEILWSTAWTLTQTNHAINFFLYCVCGSRFRKEFFAMFSRINISKCHSQEGNATSVIIVSENNK